MTKLLLLVLTCSLFLLSACKKAKVTPAATVDNMSFKVDGAAKTYTGAAIKYTSGGNLQISGYESSATSNTVFILVPNPKIGTFTVGTAGTYFQLTVQETGPIAYASGQTGTITITALSDTRVEGTFSFVGIHEGPASTPTKTVTEGKFDVAVSAQ